MASILDSSREGAVALLTLRRPDRRNALTTDLCRQLDEAARAAVDDGARVLVITGEGTAFCAGADLDGIYGEEFIAALYGMLHGLTRLPVPVIAAVNGPAIGAGTQLALASDLRVADASARFAVPTVKNGMAVDAWTIRALATLAGMGPARRMMLAAESFDRDEALSCGMVDRVGTLDDAMGWARELADFAPLTLAYTKLVLNDAAGDEQIEAAFDRIWASEDVREGSLARAEKRTPTFRGR